MTVILQQANKYLLVMLGEHEVYCVGHSGKHEVLINIFIRNKIK